ncbi:MAG: HAMP domain-containing protein [Caldilineaceae bacterium]|nr:HAMP domain-containing protein [Caldilineaceae bacterium]
MTRSLWVRLMGAFALVILFGFGLVTWFVRQTTTGQFDIYMNESGRQLAVWTAPILGAYYAQTGSWQGVDGVVANPWAYAASGDIAGALPSTGLMGNNGSQGHGAGMMGSMMSSGTMGAMGGGMVHGMMDSMWAAMGDRLLLAASDGTVVADTSGSLTGTLLDAARLDRGVAVTVDEVQVGTLLVVPYDAPASPAASFRDAVTRSVLLGGLGAAGLALLVGSLLFFQIVRPLRGLAAAAQGLARGDLSHRADVRGDDEIGQLAQTFNQMAGALQRYSTERRNLIAEIAHDLRTPLAVLQGNLEAMIDGVLPASGEELASLHQETLLLSRLIDDLGILSQAETGQLHLEKQEIDPGALVRRVAGLLERRAGERQVALVAQVEPELPTLTADPARLTQVLVNLIDNALRYAPPTSSVEVTARRVGDEIELSVRDEGPGIPNEDLPHVFNRFWRGDRARARDTGGSGLGLVIVAQLVAAHGGRVEAENRPGAGACFRVFFPLA